MSTKPQLTTKAKAQLVKLKKEIKVHNMVEISGAIARGYCTKRNSKKIMDVDLVNDMASEVLKILKNLK